MITLKIFSLQLNAFIKDEKSSIPCAALLQGILSFDYMPKYLQIQVPKSCEESWATMQRQNNGKFCNSCQKTVVDFTLMTDEQLVSFFKNRRDNVCGRFNADQLNKDLYIPRKKIPWVRYFFQITIPAFLFSSKIIAQGKVKLQEYSHVSQIASKQSKKALLSKRLKSFSGIQVAENIYADKIEIKSDAYLVKKCSPDESIGQRVVGVLGGAISIVRVRKTKIFNSPTNVSKAIEVNKTFSVYPNPILPSSEVGIKWSNTVNANQTIEVYNESGILLLKEIITVIKNTRQKTINLPPLQPAVYTIRITDSKTHKSSSQQFVVL